MDISTARLTIRDWHPTADAADAFAIYGDAEVTQWIGSRAQDATLEQVEHRLKRYGERTRNSTGTGCWAVVELATGRVIGNLLLVPLPNRQQQPSGKIEIGWHFCPASWGNGFATEAATAVLAYGFEELKLDIIYAVTRPQNQRSIRVMQRLGMQPQGLTTDYYDGIELLLYRLKRDDFRC